MTLHPEYGFAAPTQPDMPHQDLEEVIDQLPAVSPVLSDRVDSREVLPALAKVDENYQAAVTLYYPEDYSCKDIAFTLDVPVGTVKSRIARGIAQLREFLLSDGLPSLAPLNVGTQMGL